MMRTRLWTQPSSTLPNSGAPLGERLIRSGHAGVTNGAAHVPPAVR